MSLFYVVLLPAVNHCWSSFSLMARLELSSECQDLCWIERNAEVRPRYKMQMLDFQLVIILFNEEGSCNIICKRSTLCNSNFNFSIRVTLIRPVLLTFYLSHLRQCRQHDNSGTLVFKNHSPEVVHCFWFGSLEEKYVWDFYKRVITKFFYCQSDFSKTGG